MQFVQPDVNFEYGDSIKLGKIIRSGRFCLGKYTNKLEQHFQKKFDVKHAIACANATSGLLIALKALGLNGTVALPAFTWPSTLYALECNSLSPLYMDVDMLAWNMQRPPKFIVNNGVILDEIVAAVPVDTFGNGCNCEFDGPIVYDAAHSYGVTGLGKRGIVEVVSLSFTKLITGMQGGIILTDNSDLEKDMREYARLSAKLCEVNAYIALKEIKKFQERVETRKRIIDSYIKNLKVEYNTQSINEGSVSSTFCILLNTTEQRDKIAGVLMDNKVEVKIYYKPLIAGLPNTDNIYSRIISLPVYKKMGDKVEWLCSLINGA